jgi:hypothetical protein
LKRSPVVAVGVDRDGVGRDNGTRRPSSHGPPCSWQTSPYWSIGNAGFSDVCRAREVLEVVKLRCPLIGVRRFARRAGVNGADLAKFLSYCCSPSRAIAAKLQAAPAQILSLAASLLCTWWLVSLTQLVNCPRCQRNDTIEGNRYRDTARTDQVNELTEERVLQPRPLVIDQRSRGDDGNNREHDHIKSPDPPPEGRILALVCSAFATVKLIVLEFCRNLVLERM